MGCGSSRRQGTSRPFAQGTAIAIFKELFKRSLFFSALTTGRVGIVIKNAGK